jgi:hypothetical protein
LSILAGHFGQEKIWEPGPWQRANIRKAKNRYVRRCGNSLKKPATSRLGHSCPWDRGSNPAGKLFSHGPPKVTGTLPAWFQTRSAWNGPRAREKSGNFRRWIAPSGLIWRKRNAAFFPDSEGFSTNCIKSSWKESFSLRESLHKLHRTFGIVHECGSLFSTHAGKQARTPTSQAGLFGGLRQFKNGWRHVFEQSRNSSMRKPV